MAEKVEPGKLGDMKELYRRRFKRKDLSKIPSMLKPLIYLMMIHKEELKEKKILEVYRNVMPHLHWSVLKRNNSYTPALYVVRCSYELNREEHRFSLYRYPDFISISKQEEAAKWETHYLTVNLRRENSNL